MSNPNPFLAGDCLTSITSPKSTVPRELSACDEKHTGAKYGKNILHANIHVHAPMLNYKGRERGREGDGEPDPPILVLKLSWIPIIGNRS